MKIACCVIVGDNCAKTDWVRMTQSIVAKGIDKLFVVYNGEKKKFPYKVPSGLPFEWKRLPWEDDFSAQRSDSFAMVPRDEFDWILWLDTDDTLEGGDPREMLADLQPDTQGVFCRYHYGVDPDTGYVMVVQERERFMRTDCNWAWFYPIHEICHGPTNTQFARRRGPNDVIVRHWRLEGVNDDATRKRNRRILMKARREHPEEPRFTFYLANEIFAEAQTVQDEQERFELTVTAIELYKDFIGRSKWEDDTYVANHRIAELYRLVDEQDKAINADLQGIKLYPTWPDSYLGIAKSFMARGGWEQARHWAKQALACPHVETAQVREPIMEEFAPSLIVAICEEETGHLEEAVRWYEKCKGMGFSSNQLEARYESAKAKKLAKEEDKVHLVEEPIDYRGLLVGTKPEKSIAFFTRPLFEPWHPELEKVGGSGGAEKCIMELAPRFAADGWRVAVFGTPGEHRGVDANGVEWWNTDDWLNTEPFSVVVSSRSPELFDADLNAQVKLLWMHDVNSGPGPFQSPYGDRMSRIDGVVALTDWHRHHLQRLYGIGPERSVVIPNGIDPKRFPDFDMSTKVKNRFVYSSSPDRGLDVLLNLWLRIRKEFDDAELHIYYGWEAIDKIIAGQGPSAYVLQVFKDRVVAAIEEINSRGLAVIQHGRIPHDQLALELQLADMWLYPSYFMETFCITALETQAAGLIPVTSDLAALKETVSPSFNRVRGWPNNFGYHDSFMEQMRVYRDMSPEATLELRAKAREFALRHTWDAAYNRWQDVISTYLGSNLAPSGATERVA